MGTEQSWCGVTQSSLPSVSITGMGAWWARERCGIGESLEGRHHRSGSITTMGASQVQEHHRMEGWKRPSVPSNPTVTLGAWQDGTQGCGAVGLQGDRVGL